jgi:hypothetical protein
MVAGCLKTARIDIIDLSIHKEIQSWHEFAKFVAAGRSLDIASATLITSRTAAGT